MGRIIIRCADATLLRDLSWADVMITDPPYSAHVHRSAVSQSKKRGARKREMGFDHLSPMGRGWIGYAAASVRRWSVVYSCWEGADVLRCVATESGATYIRTVPWVRWSMPQLSGDRPPQGSEAVLLFHGPAKGKKSWNGPGNLTALDHKCLRGEDKHRAENGARKADRSVTGEWIPNGPIGRGHASPGALRSTTGHG